MFELPVKEIIVNEDSQVRLLEDDGTAYAALDASPSAGGFILEGFHGTILGSELVLLRAATRIIKDLQVAAAAEVTTYVLTGTSIAQDAVIRLVVESLDLTPTEFQNRGYEKRYQIKAASTVDDVGANIAAAINGDKNAPVTATYTVATDTLQLTCKNTGEQARLYSADYTLPAVTVTTAAALGIGNYNNLKNVNWSRNFEVDRNSQYFPRPGAEYTTYYFKTKMKSADGGDTDFPTETKRETTQEFRLYVREGLTLETALNLLVTDMNV